MAQDQSGIHTTSFSERGASIEYAKIAFKNSPPMSPSILRPPFGDDVRDMLE